MSIENIDPDKNYIVVSPTAPDYGKVFTGRRVIELCAYACDPMSKLGSIMLVAGLQETDLPATPLDNKWVKARRMLGDILSLITGRNDEKI